MFTDWIEVPGEEYCSMRCLTGTDINLISNRVAFIEKSPRVRIAPYTEVDDFKNWKYGPKGCDYGKDQDSRDWCDSELMKIYG